MGQNGTKFKENYKNTEKHGWELCNNYIIVRNLDESKKKKDQRSRKKISHERVKMQWSKCKLKKKISSCVEKTKKKSLTKKLKSKFILFYPPDDLSNYFYISKKDAKDYTSKRKSQKRKLHKQNNLCCDIKSIKPLSSCSSKQLPSELTSKISTIRKYLMENSSNSEYSMSFAASSAHQTTIVTNTPPQATDQTSLSWPSLKKYYDMALANLFDHSKSKSVDDKVMKPQLKLRHNNTVQIIMNVKNFSSSDTMLKMQSKNEEPSDPRLKLLQQLSKESENTLNRLLELGKKYNLKSKCPKSLKLNSNQSCQTLEVDLQNAVKKPSEFDVIPKIVNIETIIQEVPKEHESVMNMLKVTSLSGNSFDESSVTTDFSKILCDIESKDLPLREHSQKDESFTNTCSSKTTITDDHIWSSLKMETRSAKSRKEKRIRKVKIANSDQVFNVPTINRVHINPSQFESETIFSKVMKRKKVKKMSLPRKRSQNLVELHNKNDYFALEATSSCWEDFSESKKAKHVNFEKSSENRLEVKQKEGDSHTKSNSTTYLIVNKLEEVLNKMLLLLTDKRAGEVVEKPPTSAQSQQVIKFTKNSCEKLESSEISLSNLRLLPRGSFTNPCDTIAMDYSKTSLDVNGSSSCVISEWDNQFEDDFEIPYNGWDFQFLNKSDSSSRCSESSRSNMALPNPIAAQECLNEFMKTFENKLNVKKKDSNQCFSCSFQTVAFVAVLYLTLLQFILTFTVNYFSPFGK